MTMKNDEKRQESGDQDIVDIIRLNDFIQYYTVYTSEK